MFAQGEGLHRRAAARRTSGCASRSPRSRPAAAAGGRRPDQQAARAAAAVRELEERLARDARRATARSRRRTRSSPTATSRSRSRTTTWRTSTSPRYQLHSTLDYKEVVRIVQEIVINLIGAEAFHVFMVSEKTGAARAGDLRGPDARAARRSRSARALIGKAAQTGESFFADAVAHREPTPFDEPIAVIPLKIKDSVIGVISINKLLVQKTRVHHDGLRAVHAARGPRRHRGLLREALLDVRAEAHARCRASSTC